MTESWQQLPSESDVQYNCFLIYRNLGPTRSIDKAYRKYLNANSHDDEQAIRTKSASGSWGEYSLRFCWPSRAAAWDRHLLFDQGERVGILYVASIERLSEKLLRGIRQTEIRTLKWRQVLQTLEELGKHIDQEWIRLIMRGALDERNSNADDGDLE